MTNLADTRAEICLPFAGFYGSLYSGAVDHVENRECENFAEMEADLRHQPDTFQPKELRLDAGEHAEILYRVTDYHAIYEAIAKCYVDAFDYVANDMLGLKLDLKFSAMTSPPFYNFETDRVFATTPFRRIRAMFLYSKITDEHATLAKLIHERHSSRPGFASFYDNELADWLDKPLEDWDHNELCTLLLAVMSLRYSKTGTSEEDFDWAVYEHVDGDDGVYSEWSNGVDWTKYEAEVAEARADKLDELPEAHPLRVAPPAPPSPDQLGLPL